MARVFDNGGNVYAGGVANNNTSLGKYFLDANSDGTKGACQANGDECWVDPSNLIAEGALEGTYTQASPKSKVKPAAKKPVLFNQLSTYADANDFINRADNTLVAQMRDCAECHVGGGAMEYIPVAEGTILDEGARLSLRDRAPVDITSGNATTLDYFIDQYDEDEATNAGLNTVPIQHNFANSGVLEMDCLMCHLTGYDWEARKEAIRKGNFDASRVTGASLGTADNIDGSLAGTANCGKIVSYDEVNMVIDDGDGFATLHGDVLAGIEAEPPSANCSSCHFDLHKVDWKKRGTSWHPDMDPETDVHAASMTCMSCHTRDDGIEMDPNNTMSSTDDSPLWTGNGKTGASAKTLGHDPSKGSAPFSSLWNKNDNNVRTCEGCHIESAGASYWGFGGANDPTEAHAAKGLTALLIQTKGMGKMDGIASGSHLDLMTCDACHTKKLGQGPGDGVTPEGSSHSGESMYQWGTGGALVDSTGADVAGRLTDHENLYVERTMANNMTVAWEKDETKIGTRHALLTMFWRDKDDEFGYGNSSTASYADINLDGQNGGMDAVNPTHVRDAINTAGHHVLTHDGLVDQAEISAQKGYIRSYLIDNVPGLAGLTTRPNKLKLSFMGVFFKANHGTSPAAQAWGANGCSDCHAPNAGFYNGAYELKPRDLDISWTNTNGTTNDTAVGGGKPNWVQVVPFTKVNKDNYSGRIVTDYICDTYYGPDVRPLAPETNVTTTDPLAQTTEALDLAYTAAGDSYLEPCTGNGTAGIWTKYALGFIKADYQFTDFHPTIWAKGQNGRSLAIKTVYATSNTILPIDRSVGLWEKNFVTGTYDGSIVGTDSNTYTTRDTWVAYLNGVKNTRPAIHTEHAAQGMTCTDCHTTDVDGYDYAVPDQANRLTFADISFPTPTGANDGDPIFTAADGINSANPATCTTACHIATTATPELARARIGSTPIVVGATDNYMTVLDGSMSSCYNVNMATGQISQGTKDYSWTIPGTTAEENCDAPRDTDPSCRKVTYADAGTGPVGTDGTCSGYDSRPCTADAECQALTPGCYDGLCSDDTVCTTDADCSGVAATLTCVETTVGHDVTLTLTCDGSALDPVTNSVIVYDVGQGTNDPLVLVATPGVANLVTLTQTAIDDDVADVQILWGDNTRQTINATTTPSLATFIATGVPHTYNNSGTYTIDVTTTNDGILADPSAAGDTYNSDRFFYDVSVTAAP